MSWLVTVCHTTSTYRISPDHALFTMMSFFTRLASALMVKKTSRIKAMLSQIITLCNRDVQKNISELITHQTFRQMCYNRRTQHRFHSNNRNLKWTQAHWNNQPRPFIQLHHTLSGYCLHSNPNPRKSQLFIDHAPFYNYTTLYLVTVWRWQRKHKESNQKATPLFTITQLFVRLHASRWSRKQTL